MERDTFDGCAAGNQSLWLACSGAHASLAPGPAVAALSRPLGWGQLTLLSSTRPEDACCLSTPSPFAHSSARSDGFDRSLLGAGVGADSARRTAKAHRACGIPGCGDYGDHGGMKRLPWSLLKVAANAVDRLSDLIQRLTDSLGNEAFRGGFIAARSLLEPPHQVWSRSSVAGCSASRDGTSVRSGALGAKLGQIARASAGQWMESQQRWQHHQTRRSGT